jgi:hypothetical protein
MSRRLYDVSSILFLVAACIYAATGVARGLPAAWLLFVAPCVIFGVITISQLLPITSLNLPLKVTAENAPRIEPAARDFLASIKSFTMMLIVWLNGFVVSSIPKTAFFFIEGVLLVTICASIMGFLGKIRKIA